MAPMAVPSLREGQVEMPLQAGSGLPSTCSRTLAGHPSPPCSVPKDSSLCGFCAPDLCLGSAPRMSGTLKRE